ncbi:MAG: hypothetical protein HY788_13880 [Deltaproteobacteria bacterium]|nr:hypothetical protein [Deltaproteobacteria bacterium]
MRDTSKVHRVAIAGMGTVFPDSSDVDIGSPASEAPEKGRPRIRRMDEALFEAHIDQQFLKLLDRSVALGLIASMRAIRNCGWGEEPSHSEVGCCIGTAFAGTHSLEGFLDVMREKGPKKVHPRALQVTIGNAASSNMSIHHLFFGPTVACSGSFLSGLHALTYSADAMALGSFPEVMLTGGVDSPDSKWAFGLCDRYGIDSARLSEGAAVAVLNRMNSDEAGRQGNAVEWLGGGLYHWHQPSASGSKVHREWFRDAVEQALRQVGLGEDKIVCAGYSCAPGSDLAEPIRDVLSAKWGSCLYGGTSKEDTYAFAASPVRDLFTFLEETGRRNSGIDSTAGGCALFAAGSEDGDCAVTMMRMGA